MDRVCAIVVTYNSLRWIDNCLSALRDALVDYVIVDNNSSDKTISYIENHYKPVKIFKNQKNIGFGNANNIGLKWALANEYDYFLLVNQDAYIDEDLPGTLMRFLKKYPDYGIVSPLHFDGSGGTLDRLFASYIEQNSALSAHLKEGKSAEEIYAIPFVNAACWMLPRNTVVKVGLFHPLIFHYGEDDNYIHRLHYEGLKIGVVPSTKVLHDRDQKKETGLKTDFNLSFKREILVVLLEPGQSISFGNGLKSAKRIAKAICWRNNRPYNFFIKVRCFLMYVFISERIRRFNKLS